MVPRAVIERSNTSNLVDALNYVSGLQVQVECGIYYTNNIRINGMDGLLHCCPYRWDADHELAGNGLRPQQHRAGTW